MTHPQTLKQGHCSCSFCLLGGKWKSSSSSSSTSSKCLSATASTRTRARPDEPRERAYATGRVPSARARPCVCNASSAGRGAARSSHGRAPAVRAQLLVVESTVIVIVRLVACKRRVALPTGRRHGAFCAGIGGTQSRQQDAARCEWAGALGAGRARFTYALLG